jgi:serine/threonine protein kinase
VLPDGRFYYTMKLVRGQRLDQRVSPPMALAQRLHVFQKICDAVAFAHAHGVIHRDLKPQNIMLGAFGEVLILDWGIAKEVGDYPQQPGNEPDSSPCTVAGQTTPGTVVGTPGYMAPEQARGDVGKIDERADVYALGAILYYLLTGQAPAEQQAEVGTELAAASSLVPPRRYDRSIPRPLEAVCLKALAAERGARHAGAAALTGDVADFLAGRRVRAYAEGPLEAAVRLGTKYRTALTLILAYLVVRILLFFV